MAYLNSRVGQDQNDQMSPGGLEGYSIQGRCNKPLFAQLFVVFCREMYGYGRNLSGQGPDSYTAPAKYALKVNLMKYPLIAFI